MMVAIGLVQIAGYYLIGAFVRGDGGFAIPQTDTLLYCQAARRIVEGQPLSFSAGNAVSTGTTGYLYPFLLAIPYAVGFTGDSLIRAGFFLNAAFYLVFLLGWGIVVDVKVREPFSRIVAAVTIALLGQTAYSAMSQSDIGLLLAYSAGFAAALALNSRIWYGLLLILFPWIRPEGDVCVIAFFMAIGFRLLVAKDGFRDIRQDLLIAVLAAVSAAGVFALNLALTGMAGFSSLAYKGHFKTFGFFPAVFSTAADMMRMAKAFLFGIPDSPPRDLYFIPLLGGVCLWVGVLFRDWRRESDWREWVWLLAFGGGMLTVAQSGWQNTNVDRYLGWLLPTLVMGMAIGLAVAERRLKSALPVWILGSLAMLFSAGMAAVHMSFFQMITRTTDLLREFAVVAEGSIPKGASVGTWGDCGFAYEMSPRRICHLSGIYSMEYLVRKPPAGVFELLKHETGKRFDYWFFNQGTHDDMGIPVDGAIAHQTVVGPAGYELLRADWTAFDSASRVPPAPVKGAVLKARVDVGYDPDEKKAGYEVTMRYNVDEFAPFSLYDKNRGTNMVEVARIIVGMDSMTVPLEPGRDAYVVMRVYPKKAVPVRRGNSTAPMTYEFANPLKLSVAVDGEIADTVSVAYSKEGFSDASFKIPGACIKGDCPRIAFMGDHITCGYWFYQ